MYFYFIFCKVSELRALSSQVLIGQYFLQIFNNQKYCDPAGDYPVSKR